jgi:hypothetical protein
LFVDKHHWLFIIVLFLNNHYMEFVIMKLVIAIAALVFASAPSFAADKTEKEAKPVSPAQQAQRERMKACNAEAGKQQLKGDERKTFMSGCLKADKS